MKTNLTELVFILDRSGSMQGLEKDTIGGFNAMLEKQKKEPGEALVSTVLFDDRIEVLHDRVKLGEVRPITEKEYCVRGCTALLDAVGGAIRHIGNIHKYARPEDVPERTLFVITTDGMENASRRYTADKVRRMIEHEKEKYGWEFLFLGANIDAVETAGSLGIAPDRAANYRCDGEGTRLNYEVVCQAVSAVRGRAPLDEHWKDAIEADLRKRPGARALNHVRRGPSGPPPKRGSACLCTGCSGRCRSRLGPSSAFQLPGVHGQSPRLREWPGRSPVCSTWGRPRCLCCPGRGRSSCCSDPRAPGPGA